MANQSPTDKPQRLYFKTYLQMIRNSVGTQMFRNFYIQTADGVEQDSLSDGEDSCAFYVSSVLTLFRAAAGVHGTIRRTVEDLQQSGWQIVPKDHMQPGDVIVWGTTGNHIGFYIGNGRAISTSSKAKQVAEHNASHDDSNPISQVLRYTHWDGPASNMVQ